jgi:FdhD protein
MSKTVDVTRIHAAAKTAARDVVAIEEPLEIRLHGRPFSVIMRTPGADRELAAGFLLSERVLRGPDDLGTIEYCSDAVPRDGEANQTNVVNVTLTDPSRAAALLAAARHVTTNSSCGLCGRQTIESLTTDVAPLAVGISVHANALTALPRLLRERQIVFDQTGGLHAAGLFTVQPELVDVAEDVGRHNAVDKVIGRQLMRDALPLSGVILMVSGRSSFEIVQKAVFAGIPIVASVSAPSSLAIELAAEMAVTLVGFVRGEGFNVYTAPQRIQAEA